MHLRIVLRNILSAGSMHSKLRASRLLFTPIGCPRWTARCCGPKHVANHAFISEQRRLSQRCVDDRRRGANEWASSCPALRHIIAPISGARVRGETRPLEGREIVIWSKRSTKFGNMVEREEDRKAKQISGGKPRWTGSPSSVTIAQFTLGFMANWLHSSDVSSAFELSQLSHLHAPSHMHIRSTCKQVGDEHHFTAP